MAMSAHLRWEAAGLALLVLGGLRAAVIAAEPADRADTVRELLAALKSDDWAERYHAAESSGQMGSRAKRAVSALLAALKDKEPFVRAQAALALGRIGSPRRK
jgi:HEAT repeat protein